MGKKRIFKQTEDEAIKEVDNIKTALKKSEESATTKKVTTKKGRLYIKVSYNNVRVSATDDLGNMIAWSTSGHLRFKGPKKATPYAAAQVTENLLQKIKKVGLTDFDIFISGIGGGRDSSLRTMAAKKVNMLSIKETTGIPHGGCRPRKARRV